MKNEMPSGTTAFLDPQETYESIGLQVEQATFGSVGLTWWLALLAALGLIGVLVISVLWLLYEGVGIWGNNVPVTWALDIVGYDWWIGLATGSLGISVILLLLNQGWRSSISRISETVAVLAAVAAAIYPIIHLGRPWFFYWNLPYPNTLLLWPQFRSPLYWDAIDIVSYLTISVSFWYLGMLPDFASLRDRAIDRMHARDAGKFAKRVAQAYGVAALGWRGSAAHWHRWSLALRIIGLLGLIVVVSLQTGAAVMFAGSLEPGWHDTMMPVTFVIDALFSGIAATAVVIVVLRSAFSLGGLITSAHLDRLAWLLLGFGLADLYCLATENFGTLITGDSYAMSALGQRVHGPHAWAFWIMLLAAIVPVQLFWLRSARRAAPLLLLVGLSVCVGSWADHFMVIVATLQRDFLPSVDKGYSIGIWGAATFAGSCGLFLFLLLLGLRVLPILSLVETRRLTHPGAESTRTPVASDTLDLPKDAPIWGVAGEFAEASDMINAARSLRGRRLGRVDLYSPLPVTDAPAVLGMSRRPIQPFAVAGVIVGAAAMMGMCLYATGYDYVFNIGGRPRFSWPAFMVPTVSFAMMAGTIATVAAMLFQNRLPRLNHPAFNIPGIGGASRDRFFLVVEKQGEEFDAGRVELAFQALPERPLVVHRVRR